MGHHIDSAGRFQSDKYPELGPDKIVVSFKHPQARAALRLLADSYRAIDPELADDIRARLLSLTEAEERECRERAEKAAPPVDRSQRQLTNGSPVSADHRDIDPATGQQKGYVVLTPEERAKGFVRPVRRSYTHVGIRPKYPLRDLTDDEKARYADEGFTMFETYPESEHPKTGRFWTAAELYRRCGLSTTMGLALAETYARDPKFYGGTFCAACRQHFPVEEFRWEGTDEIVGS